MTPARWLLIGLWLVAIVTLLNVAFVGLVAFTPERCASCHLETSSQLSMQESHVSVVCQDCHVGSSSIEKIGFASRQVYGMYLRLPVLDGRATSAVDDRRCSSCHDLSDTPFEQSPFRVNHVTCAVDRACTDCHSRVAHGDSVTWPRSYDMFECVSCHMSRSVSVECDLCHTERTAQERVRTGSFALTHGSNWRQAHGMGDSLACAACHAAEKCEKCHGPGVPHGPGFSANHSDFATLDDAQCVSCHSSEFCSDCHGLEMPHRDTFVMEHPALVEAEGQASCDICHAESDCTTCHIMHIHPGGANEPSRGD